MAPSLIDWKIEIFFPVCTVFTKKIFGKRYNVVDKFNKNIEHTSVFLNIALFGDLHYLSIILWTLSTHKKIQLYGLKFFIFLSKWYYWVKNKNMKVILFSFKKEKKTCLIRRNYTWKKLSERKSNKASGILFQKRWTRGVHVHHVIIV